MKGITLGLWILTLYCYWVRRWEQLHRYGGTVQVYKIITEDEDWSSCWRLVPFKSNHQHQHQTSTLQREKTRAGDWGHWRDNRSRNSCPSKENQKVVHSRAIKLSKIHLMPSDYLELSKQRSFAIAGTVLRLGHVRCVRESDTWASWEGQGLEARSDEVCMLNFLFVA